MVTNLNLSRKIKSFVLQLILEVLDRPQDKLKFIHITGTNGKGSTAAMLSKILEDAGYKVGLYTSPHIRFVNERIQINSSPIPMLELRQLEQEVKSIYLRFGVTPTEGFSQTAIALKYFADNNVDIVVFESHIGGLYDPTNIIKNTEVAVLTDIDADHFDVLGDTIEDIATNKSYIIKENSSVVLYPSKHNSVIEIIKEKSIGHKLTISDFSALCIKKNDMNGLIVDYKNYKDINLPLLGEYQSKNLAVVIDTIEFLINKGYNISKDNIYNGIKNTKWPGRFEIRDNMVLDVAHNPQGLQVLLDSINYYLPNKKNIFVFGNYTNHDYKEMLRMIEESGAEFVYFLKGRLKREVNPEVLSENYSGEHMVCDSIDQVFKLLSNYDKDKYNIIITGSFPVVAMAKNIIERGIKRCI